MSQFEVVVPPLATTPEAQAKLEIEPDELVKAALGKADCYDVEKKFARDIRDESRELGFVSPLERPGKPPVYVRALYPVPKVSAGSIWATIPHHDAGALSAHMQWYADELELLEQAGAKILTNYPLLLRDRGRWGDSWALLSAVEQTNKRPNPDLSDDERSTRKDEAQRTICSVGRILLEYYTGFERADNTVIGDLCVKQFAGNTGLDYDPYRCDRVEELKLLSLYLDRVKYRPETEALHAAVDNNYVSARAAAIYATRAKFDKQRAAAASQLDQNPLQKELV